MTSSNNYVIKIKDFKLTVLIFLLIFFSNDTYMFGSNKTEIMVSLPRYVMLVFCCINVFGFIKSNYIKKAKYMVLGYSLLVVVFTIVSIINHEYITRLLVKVLCMTTALFLCSKISFKDYSYAFNNAMFFISICAIFLTLLAYVASPLVLKLPYITNKVGIKFYTIIFAGLDERSISNFAIRTGGIFWEPGVFQMYLNIAILYELFVLNCNKKRLSALIIAMILTFSTTGYIVFAWIIMTYYLFFKTENYSKNRIAWNYLILFIFTVCGLVFLNFSSIANNVFGKLTDKTNGSTFVRQASVFINLEIARDNPLTGIGMKIMEDEFEKRSYASTLVYGWTRQNTNTLLYQYSAHGIPFGLIFTIGTYLFGNLISRKRIIVFCVFIMIVLLYIGENLTVSILPYIFILYGFDYKRQLKQYCLNTSAL